MTSSGLSSTQNAAELYQKKDLEKWLIRKKFIKIYKTQILNFLYLPSMALRARNGFRFHLPVA
jgi:hypothetical protein